MKGAGGASEGTQTNRTYALGYSPEETARLQKQAQLRTRRHDGCFEGSWNCLQKLKVLDIGSGAGDVALIAAGLVGPSGTVVGVDSDPAVLDTARERVRAAGRRSSP